ncbi:MAG: hypothetical protein JNL73_02005 [Anaerolineales bacterium]|nr:hypothetical protein [Anaerolineales bacterium]
MTAQLVLPFDSDYATLAVAGGKGVNLARLTRAGFPVPPGFIVTTDAYRDFVTVHGLTATITTALTRLRADDASALEHASTVIRAAFRMGQVPQRIVTEVQTFYARLDAVAVAVRSSATAEDLPDLSFAGQQDTFLNVVGVDALTLALIECWSSLWTARAIGYRLRNDIAQDTAALAIVVQAMAPATSSGVLFTANPLTGHRGQIVIDATLGLGEALVSGQVEPDHFVVEAVTGVILAKTLGRKQVATRPRPEGGVETVPTAPETRFALSDEETGLLVDLGRRVQAEYGAPQDIEWALAEGRLALLQTRAITSLFPIPEAPDADRHMWFSFGAVQGMLGPVTPLGRDFIALAFAAGARAFGARWDYRTQRLVFTAGERLWIRLDGVLRHPLGFQAAQVALPMVEPSVARIIFELGREPGFAAGAGRSRLSTLGRLAGFALPVLIRFPRAMFFPEAARSAFETFVAETLAGMTSLTQATPDEVAVPGRRLHRVMTVLADFAGRVVPGLLQRFVPILGPSIALLRVLTEFAAQAETGEHGIATLALEVTRGLPDNVTTEMDLALWQTARDIRSDPTAAARFEQGAPEQLAAEYCAGSLPPVAQKAVRGFLGRYGMRGVREIDLGRPRWREDPAQIMQTLQSYLQITDPQWAPDAVFARGAEAAEAAIDQLANAAGRQPGGWFKTRLVRFAARRIRLLMGAREAPKFLVVRLMGLVRSALLEAGQGLADQGVLTRADDVFYLHIDELGALAAAEARDWRGLVAERRAADSREARRRQVPRVLVGDGRAFFEGLGATVTAGEALTGSPVSPGIVEGVVRVVLDPHTTQLLPGEILVCPGTDPAWTPLFMAAAGLVTEVGGMMTHGSVVAREYGFPAVVGVHQATVRLHTGQRVRIDGAQGMITVLEARGEERGA